MIARLLPALRLATFATVATPATGAAGARAGAELAVAEMHAQRLPPAEWLRN